MELFQVCNFMMVGGKCNAAHRIPCGFTRTTQWHLSPEITKLRFQEQPHFLLYTPAKGTSGDKKLEHVISVNVVKVIALIIKQLSLAEETVYFHNPVLDAV